MPVDASQLTQEELDELFTRLHEAAEAHNDLAELARWFPTPALLRLVTLIARLKEAIDKIPLEFWMNLIRFMNCDLEAIRDASKEELRQLLELIELHMEVERENPSIPLTDEQFQTALDEVRRVRDAIQSLDQAQALEEVRRLKERLKLQYAVFWGLLISIYNLGLLDDLAEAGGGILKPRVGAAIKSMLRRIITAVLEKKLPQQAAGKLVPYVGLILTAAEVAAFAGVVDEISDLKDEICRLLCVIVRELAARGMRWPLENPNVWVTPELLISDEYPVWEVTVQNFVRCSYQKEREDECEWGEPCLIPFTSTLPGTAVPLTIKTIILREPVGLFMPLSARFNGRTMTVPNDMDAAALANCACLQPRPDGAVPIKCYTFTRLQAFGQARDPLSPLGFRFKFGPRIDIINGVKIF